MTLGIKKKKRMAVAKSAVVASEGFGRKTTLS